jgi:hypothetical protein
VAEIAGRPEAMDVEGQALVEWYRAFDLINVRRKTEEHRRQKKGWKANFWFSDFSS